MSRLRLVLLGLLAVFAASVVASSIAVANPVWVVNGTTLPAGQSVKVVSEGGPYISRAEPAGIKSTIECGRAEDVSVLFGGTPGTDENTVQFTKCVVVEPEKCKLVEPIQLKITTELVLLIRTAAGQPWKLATKTEWEATSTANRRFGDLSSPAVPGTPFVVLHFIGPECIAAGEFAIEGSYNGVIEELGETNGETLEFTPESSNLTFGGRPSSLTGKTKQEIVNGAGERTGEKIAVRKT